jgi:hypothetical protein
MKPIALQYANTAQDMLEIYKGEEKEDYEKYFFVKLKKHVP